MGSISEEETCEKLKGLIQRQVQMCKRNLEVMDSVRRGAQLAIEECQYQFRNRRWNCSTLDSLPVFGKVVTQGEGRAHGGAGDPGRAHCFRGWDCAREWPDFPSFIESNGIGCRWRCGSGQDAGGGEEDAAPCGAAQYTCAASSVLEPPFHFTESETEAQAGGRTGVTRASQRVTRRIRIQTLDRPSLSSWPYVGKFISFIWTFDEPC